MEDINKKEKFDANAYISNYTKEHYDKITIVAPKGTKANYKNVAKSEGLSVSQYIIGAVKFYKKNKSDADTDTE